MNNYQDGDVGVVDLLYKMYVDSKKGWLRFKYLEVNRTIAVNTRVFRKLN